MKTGDRSARREEACNGIFRPVSCPTEGEISWDNYGLTDWDKPDATLSRSPEWKP